MKWRRMIAKCVWDEATKLGQYRRTGDQISKKWRLNWLVLPFRTRTIHLFVSIPQWLPISRTCFLDGFQLSQRQFWPFPEWRQQTRSDFWSCSQCVCHNLSVNSHCLNPPWRQQIGNCSWCVWRCFLVIVVRDATSPPFSSPSRVRVRILVWVQVRLA